MVYVTKCFRFASAHRIYNAELSEQENYKLFGGCNRDHGHNYKLEVTIQGTIDPQSGMVINLKDLKTWVEVELAQLDHHHLDDVLYFQSRIQTIENIVVYLWERLSKKVPNNTLYRIKLWETEDNYVEYFGR